MGIAAAVAVAGKPRALLNPSLNSVRTELPHEQLTDGYPRAIDVHRSLTATTHLTVCDARSTHIEPTHRGAFPWLELASYRIRSKNLR